MPKDPAPVEATVVIVIYCHIHRESGKRYVGQTRLTMRRRWLQHLGCVRRGSTYFFHAAIRKYGADAFDHIVLEGVDSEKAANEAEKRWITLYKSNNSAFGYNLHSGGGGAARDPSPEGGLRRSLIAKAREAAMTPEQKTARAMRGLAGLSPEQRSEIARRREANRTPEARSRSMRHARQAQNPKPRKEPTPRKLLTPEQRREAILLREARKTPEQRSEAVRKGHAKRTPEAKTAAVQRMVEAKRKALKIG